MQGRQALEAVESYPQVPVMSHQCCSRAPATSEPEISPGPARPVPWEDVGQDNRVGSVGGGLRWGWISRCSVARQGVTGGQVRGHLLRC